MIFAIHAKKKNTKKPPKKQNPPPPRIWGERYREKPIIRLFLYSKIINTYENDKFKPKRKHRKVKTFHPSYQGN